MKYTIRFLMVAFMLLVSAASLFADEPLRVFVGEFSVVGGQGKDDARAAVQALLASRINGQQILSVSSADEAEVTVGGTYLVIGKNYSLDAVAKDAADQTVCRTFVQGEGGQEALFAATGTLAEKLADELNRKNKAGLVNRTPRAIVAVQQPVVVPQPPTNTDIVRPGTVAADSANIVRSGTGSDIIHQQQFHRGVPNAGEIKRLNGMFNLMTPGGVAPDGRKMMFMATDRSVQLFREGESRPVTGFTVKPIMKIVGLDYVDADGDGAAELYVTMVNQGDIASQIWEFKNNRLTKVAEDIPYFFRAIAVAGGDLKLYAQEQGRDDVQYYGDLYEVVRQGKKIIRKAKITLPRYGNIYSFNQFRNHDGELLTVVFHEENYLVVYDKNQKEIWRSNDRFGGSELYYTTEDLDNVRVTGMDERWFFLNQRIQVTAQNEILVGKNEGFFVIGNARMYKKGAVYNLYWNGAALEELWHTKDTQNYMPDFYFDEKTNELYLLQISQREDTLMGRKGASSLQIKKVE
ncbi:MAG: VCBS repeat-containing protein [Trichlorobacter sp.]|nr:VCBS repeat-containing protein [Trichlorobacter sp.]